VRRKVAQLEDSLFSGGARGIANKGVVSHHELECV
jgi:hypothetical protein